MTLRAWVTFEGKVLAQLCSAEASPPGFFIVRVLLRHSFPAAQRGKGVKPVAK